MKADWLIVLVIICAAALLSLLFAFYTRLSGGLPVETAPGNAVIASVPTESPAPVSAGIEAGEYYGFWEIFNCSAEWASVEDKSWPCLALIDEKSLLLWDGDYSKSDPIARLELDLSSGEITGGSFLQRRDDFAGWTLELEDDGEAPMLWLRGSYESQLDGSFGFAVSLRLWKSLWPEGERPDNYGSWYLPLIEKGAAMPDNFY